MVLRFLSILVAGIALGFIIIANSDALFYAWTNSRFFPSPNRYGDLYNLTNLRTFKERDYATQSVLTPLDFPRHKRQADVHLYLFGDSFIDRIPLESYCAGQTEFERVGVSSREITLNPNQVNILIIENVERGIADRFSNYDYFNTYIENAGYYTATTRKRFKNNPSVNLGIWGDFGGHAVEERLQLLLGNYGPFLLLKEFKAWVNLWLLNKVDGNNVLSSDKKYLFYQNEASRTVGYTSSFYPIPDTVVTQFVNNMDKVYRHYRQMGFDEVYFAIIPNKATILAPNEGYNRLIPRIMKESAGRFQMIDMYSKLKNTIDYYHVGDGHWNKKGMLMWVNEVNNLTRKVSRKALPPVAGTDQRLQTNDTTALRVTTFRK
ncbi:hypothetical protein [Telluribacter sp.]|jgi:hypothetical protein|uniref:hypothetical protein n=1 Tax=Telluribacter sp. TaxID=1978767 RepID=UPI002E0FABCC|nr:hypothetical protein [Telluribacter sp.]